MLSRVFVFDIDNTLSDDRHRSHHAQNREWDLYHSLCYKDPPHPSTVALALALGEPMFDSNHDIVICTGRNERWRSITMDWLNGQGIYPAALLMRGDQEYSPTLDMKLAMLDSHFDGRDKALAEVCIIFEDDERTVEGLRNAGFQCHHVRNRSM